MVERLGLDLRLELAPPETTGEGAEPYKAQVVADWSRLLGLAIRAGDACVTEGAVRMIHVLENTSEEGLRESRHRLHALWTMAAGVVGNGGEA